MLLWHGYQHTHINSLQDIRREEPTGSRAIQNTTNSAVLKGLKLSAVLRVMEQETCPLRVVDINPIDPGGSLRIDWTINPILIDEY